MPKYGLAPVMGDIMASLGILLEIFIFSMPGQVIADMVSFTPTAICHPKPSPRTSTQRQSSGHTFTVNVCPTRIPYFILISAGYTHGFHQSGEERRREMHYKAVWLFLPMQRGDALRRGLDHNGLSGDVSCV